MHRRQQVGAAVYAPQHLFQAHTTMTSSNSLAYSHTLLVRDLQRIKSARHDLLVLDLAFWREEVLEWRTDHYPVARQCWRQEDALLRHALYGMWCEPC